MVRCLIHMAAAVQVTKRWLPVAAKSSRLLFLSKIKFRGRRCADRTLSGKPGITHETRLHPIVYRLYCDNRGQCAPKLGSAWGRGGTSDMPDLGSGADAPG